MAFLARRAGRDGLAERASAGRYLEQFAVFLVGEQVKRAFGTLDDVANARALFGQQMPTTRSSSTMSRTLGARLNG